jgi:hypothetical protein
MAYKVKILTEVEERLMMLKVNHPALGTKMLELMNNPSTNKKVGKDYYTNAGNRYCYVYSIKADVVIVTKLLYRSYLHKVLKGKIDL